MGIAVARRNVTRLRSLGTVADGHGNLVPDWSTPASLVIGTCLLAPGGSTELVENRGSVSHPFTLYAPAGADIVAADRIQIDADVFEVDGAPAHWPLGTTVALTRWEG